MSLEIMRDPRIRAMEWRDLVPLSPLEVWKQLLLPLPWVGSALIAAWLGWYVAALPLSFIFFLTGLRVVHDAYHYSLNISTRATQWVMYGLSVFMLGSMHAVQLTHLHHHKHCMDDEDVEAASALMPWWKAILVGPLFPFKTHRLGLSLANRVQKRWMIFELATTGVLIACAFASIGGPVLRYQVATMCIGHCMTSFFAVWTVHHDCDRSHFIARTIRNRVKSLVAFEMFYHVEHHLFPKVPTCHLAKLSERLDEVAPELQTRQVY